jgi:hypothetical protein
LDCAKSRYSPDHFRCGGSIQGFMVNVIHGYPPVKEKCIIMLRSESRRNSGISSVKSICRRPKFEESKGKGRKMTVNCTSQFPSLRSPDEHSIPQIHLNFGMTHYPQTCVHLQTWRSSRVGGGPAFLADLPHFRKLHR